MTLRTPIHDLIGRMERMLAELVTAGDPQAYFLATYVRTTQAVARELAAGRFLDRKWTEQWDIAFARRYLDAVDRWRSEGRAPGPWQMAFARSDDEPRIPPLATACSPPSTVAPPASS